MSSKTIFFLVGLFLSTAIYSQTNEQYRIYVAQADSLYEVGHYELSAARYTAAFDQMDGKAYTNDRYNAACSFALSNNMDTAFYHLFYLAEHEGIKFKDLDHISKDQDLNSLHEDDRWNRLLAIIKQNKLEFEKDLDLDLVAILDEIYTTDQGLRQQIRGIQEEFGQDSPEMKSHWVKIQEADSINEIKVTEILDEQGWLGPKIITDKGNLTLFLLIQHAPLETCLFYSSPSPRNRSRARMPSTS